MQAGAGQTHRQGHAHADQGDRANLAVSPNRAAESSRAARGRVRSPRGQAAPRGIDWSLEDWRSRAAACVVYQLRDLDDAGRLEALRLRAAQRGLQLPPETADYLLRRMPRDLPSLFEILDLLDEASLVAQRRLTVPFIRDALERLAGTKP